MRLLKGLLVSCAVGLSGCQVADSAGSSASAPLAVDASPVTGGDWYQPVVGVTWQWQLLVSDGQPLNTDYDVTIYDIDLFDTAPSTIDALQASGRKVICYFSAGSYENFRDDEGEFDGDVLGNTLDGWPDERWLDIRSPNVHRIMEDRLDLAVEKGCNGVEPDNVDGYLNDPGFSLTANDQLAYNRFIANEAHRRGLAVGLKNDLDQVAELVEYYDFAVNEQCFQYDECAMLDPFISAGKPVLNAEYPEEDDDLSLGDSSVAALCTNANSREFSTLVLPLDLDDAFRTSCQDEI
ncbi:endo alpha-1,4 polygalactosaminidase [Saccharospirillum impatiens]|uniref:endo alpha-1,4 polygalactosaminidase n=1 Tax=Saccharospirillum impatiens TaxID=169438 RepID=UPI000409105C|nr:endo alpha-1,4 polygalactosaminidase [Saccharospirillum impatiens]